MFFFISRALRKTDSVYSLRSFSCVILSEALWVCSFDHYLLRMYIYNNKEHMYSVDSHMTSRTLWGRNKRFFVFIKKILILILSQTCGFNIIWELISCSDCFYYCVSLYFFHVCDLTRTTKQQITFRSILGLWFVQPFFFISSPRCALNFAKGKLIALSWFQMSFLKREETRLIKIIIASNRCLGNIVVVAKATKNSENMHENFSSLVTYAF